MKTNQVEKDVKLHGIKFYNIVARGIKYLAYNKESGERLGVVRLTFYYLHIFVLLILIVNLIL